LTTKPTVLDRIDQKIFDALYCRSLVYNTCWEDPAVDRRALDIGPDDTMLVITSAGCNVLDYSLAGPARIHAVDANPRQTALLELKLAGIRRLDHADFFALFGDGRHPRFAELYGDCLRGDLSPFARAWWDRRGDWFAQPGGSFYFHGLSGLVARLLHTWLRLQPRLAAAVDALFDSRSLGDQRLIYDRDVGPRLWRPGVNWTLSRQVTMSLLGVPHPQRREVQAQHAGGIAGFIREAVEYVFRQLPVATNYFWSVYVRGRYTPTCCPAYLEPAGFAALKAGLAERIRFYTGTVTQVLHATDARISKFVLLDHMDWMSSYQPAALAEEWEAILCRATPDARIIFRSAHAAPRYLDRLAIGPGARGLDELLCFRPELAAELQALDRVHTYAGFHIADIRA
jgi:S-adenosylmethionine-diacylglycerol 3-amino-3-carboxypropyl transferase